MTWQLPACLIALLVAAPGPDGPENLLKNPGFEDPVNAAWVANGRPSAKIDPQLDTEVVHTGKRSLRTGGHNFVQRVPVSASRRYRCRVFVRCVDMKGNGAHVTIGATDAAGRFIKGMWAMTTALRGTLDWKEYQRDGLAFPEGTTRAWIACYGSQDSKTQKAGGMAWFDDLVFEDVTLEAIAKALNGRTADQLRASTVDAFGAPEAGRLKARAQKLLEDLNATLAKPPDEVTWREAQSAAELIGGLDSLQYHAKIETLLAR